MQYQVVSPASSLLRRHVPRPFGHHSAHERGKTFHNIYTRSYLPTIISRYLSLVEGLVSYFLLLQKTSSDREDFLYRLPLGQLLVPPVSSSALTYPHSADAKHSPRKCRVVLLDVDVRNEPVHNSSVPRDERQIRARHLVPDQVLLLRENPVQHSKHPPDLVIVPLDRAR